jgi:hypothetical protein
MDKYLRLSVSTRVADVVSFQPDHMNHHVCHTLSEKLYLDHAELETQGGDCVIAFIVIYVFMYIFSSNF